MQQEGRFHRRARCQGRVGGVLWRMIAAVAVLAACGGTAGAGDPRHGDLRTLDGYFPFTPVDSAAAWQARSAEIRLRVLVAAGLWPEPTKCALNAVVHGRIDMGDYTIEKVYLESMPGHFVTGNLYRPKGDAAAGRRPGVLMPHGHWPNGRFVDAGEGKGGDAKVREALAGGSERFESAARSPLQARCVQAARMGCVVFHYDMLANADSVQFPSHRRAAPPDADDAVGRGWLLGGARATGWLQSRFGIQTWNGVRALDFLLGLPDVDPARVAVSGASGGATQTMMLTAVDGRVRAAFPAVMVSTAMQGGCACENAVYLRIGQGNIDIAAAAAPRPLGLTSADDWTIELQGKGHPDLLALYKLLGAPGNYEAHFNTQFKHNYNHVSRAQFYGFLNRHFKLGLQAPVLERDFEFLGSDRLTVWDSAHPAPAGERVGDPHERSLTQWWADDARTQMAPLLEPRDRAELDRARDVIGGALSVMLGRRTVSGEQLEFLIHEEADGPGCAKAEGILRDRASGEEVGVTLLKPPGDDWGQARCIAWLDPRGAGALFGPSGAASDEVASALAAGWAVLGIDVHRSGSTKNRRVIDTKAKSGDPWQRDPLFTYGYNPPLFVQRVHDVMTAVGWLRGSSAGRYKRVRLMSARGAGHWAAAASAALGDSIERAAIDVGGFRFSDVRSPWDADFLPGAPKYGDIGGMLLLSVPRPIWLAGADEGALSRLKAAYRASANEDRLSCDAGGGEGAAGRAIAWLVSE